MAELAPWGQPDAFKLGFAGDTFNTAWYLARITSDIDVSFLTAVGDDTISQDMRIFMRNSRISDAHVHVVAGKTVGLYLIHLNNGERSFSYWRESSAARQLADNPFVLTTAMQEADLIYYSGITLAILEPTARATLFDALANARAAGKTVAFDTNLRPRLWRTPGEMKTTIMRAAAQSDIVLPSHEDEAAWFGDGTALATLDRYAEAGAQCVIVKNSAEPVLFQQGPERGEIAVDPTSDIIDTTAAGDSFNAGVLAEIMRQKDIKEGIALGCHLAGQVVRQNGALVAIEADASAASR